MAFIYAVEWFVLAFVIWVMVTQVLMPMILNMPLFPTFRWRRVNKERASLKEGIALNKADEELETLYQEYLNTSPNQGEGEQNDISDSK